MIIIIGWGEKIGPQGTIELIKLIIILNISIRKKINRFRLTGKYDFHAKYINLS